MSKPDPSIAAVSQTASTNGNFQALQRIGARIADVGGIPVARALPSRQRRLVGAWCFLDHAGPADFAKGEPGMQVGPHPHIGLQTFTWMIEGEVLHTDSLGNSQVIRPGQVNLMTAGRGIAHAEQSLPGQARLHAAQLWIALPAEHSQIAPAFDHYPHLPSWTEQSVACTLLVGEFNGHTAPARTFSPLLGVELLASEPASLTLPLRPDFEYAMLPLEGSLQVGTEAIGLNELAYLGIGRSSVEFSMSRGGRVLMVGGEPLNEEILIWWNFVGHDKVEIARAQHDWERGGERYGNVAGLSGPRLMPPPLPWPGIE
ncbi:pirin family protein [Paralcaligenes ginsengisoli]